METLVAVYPSRQQAETVRTELIARGFPQDKIALSPETTTEAVQVEERHQSFWDWLFGSDVDDNDRRLYNTSLSGGRCALSVNLTDGQDRDEIQRFLHDNGAVDISDTTGDTTAAPVATEGETRVPIVKEELVVGKRTTEQRYHVRAYPVSRTVTEQVPLRDETVVVERRKTGEYPATDKDLAPKEFEVTERHEEPVVGKTTRADEEVVVSRTATERTETVSDEVKETKVEVTKPGEKPKPV